MPYEQLFNDLNDGDLSGQDSWGSGSGDVFNVQSAWKYEGAKALKVASASGNSTLYRVISAETSGDRYQVFRMSRTDGDVAIYFYNGTTLLFKVLLDRTGSIRLGNESTFDVAIAGAFEADHDYVLHANFNMSTMKVKARVHDGVSWSDWTAEQDIASGSQVDKLRLFSHVGAAATDFYIDTITYVPGPTVTTQAATDIATTSITGNGNITDTGGENCTRRGFCYMEGTSGDPTTADSVAYDDGDYGTGAYTKSITGLTAGTSYRVRAYAVNSGGTGYGTTVQVKTAYDTTLSVIATADMAFSKIFTAVKAFSITATAAITLSKIMTAYKAFSVIGSSIITLSKEATLYKALSVTAQGIISLAKGLVYVMELSATATASLVLEFARVFSQMLSATAGAVASMAQIRIFYRTLSVTASGIISLAKDVAYSMVLSATATATISLIKIKIAVKNLSVTAIAVLSVIRLTTFYRTLSVTAISKIKIFVNGVNTFFANKFSKRNSTFSNKFSARNSIFRNKF